MMVRHYYNAEHDIGYHYDSKEVEIVLGEKTRREKDKEAIFLPIKSLLNFAHSLMVEKLVNLTEKGGE